MALGEDFNINISGWSPGKIKLMNLLESYDLIHVKFPTRIPDTNESLLDLIITTEKVQIAKIYMTDIDGISDHLANLCVFQIISKKPPQKLFVSAIIENLSSRNLT